MSALPPEADTSWALISAKCQTRTSDSSFNLFVAQLEWNQPDARELASLGSPTRAVCGISCPAVARTQNESGRGSVALHAPNS